VPFPLRAALSVYLACYRHSPSMAAAAVKAPRWLRIPQGDEPLVATGLESVAAKAMATPGAGDSMGLLQHIVAELGVVPEGLADAHAADGIAGAAIRAAMELATAPPHPAADAAFGTACTTVAHAVASGIGMDAALGAYVRIVSSLTLWPAHSGGGGDCSGGVQVTTASTRDSHAADGVFGSSGTSNAGGEIARQEGSATPSSQTPPPPPPPWGRIADALTVLHAVTRCATAIDDVNQLETVLGHGMAARGVQPAPSHDGTRAKRRGAARRRVQRRRCAGTLDHDRGPAVARAERGAAGPVRPAHPRNDDHRAPYRGRRERRAGPGVLPADARRRSHCARAPARCPGAAGRHRGAVLGRRAGAPYFFPRLLRPCTRTAWPPPSPTQSRSRPCR
jgi:hypothetical protein